jgi:hypothetical protein
MSKISKFAGSTSIGKKASGKANSTSASYLLIEQMKLNPMYKTVFTLPGKLPSVSGLAEGCFAFNGSADWKQLAEFGMDKMNQSLALAQGIGSASGVLSDEQAQQFNAKSTWLTECRWNGSAIPVFNVKLVLPSYSATDAGSPMNAVRNLMRCVFPTQKGALMLGAPLGYTITNGDKPLNTITVSKGNFFLAPDQVIKSVSCVFSQEVMEDGNPLYVEANIEFMPWRMPTYDEVMSYFIL